MTTAGRIAPRGRSDFWYLTLLKWHYGQNEPETPRHQLKPKCHLAHPGMNSQADKENPFKRVKLSIRVRFNALYISDCDLWTLRK